MTTEDFRRKVTAILSEDVEGYSSMMGDNEELTISTLTGHKTFMKSTSELTDWRKIQARS